ncbi:MAG: DUF1295 domain-containing protein [Ruminococcus sp.]|nr:DUF1295 domain-containing protein [Ruminococcus sp.]MBR1394017.1 DUF1295 domain-containing protein [Ruminococcus sp.]
MELTVVFAVILVITLLGFLKTRWFYSAGFGLSVAGVAVALFILPDLKFNIFTGLLCGLLVFYGLRLGGYLLLREVAFKTYRERFKNEEEKQAPIFVKIAMWALCSGLYVCMVCPVLFRVQSGKGFDGFVLAGLILAAAGIFIEFIADSQKAEAKRRAPKSFVYTGLYRMVRCPNYFGELLLWTGIFVSGLNVYSGWWQWAMAIVGWAGIVYVILTGTRRTELRWEKTYGEDPMFQAYAVTVPVILPLVPLYSVKDLKWLVVRGWKD